MLLSMPCHLIVDPVRMWLQMKESVSVELRAAAIPGLPGLFADHHWLLVIRKTEEIGIKTCHRWEIWQKANQSKNSWGHLHENLLDPTQGVGNGPSRVVQRWLDGDAIAIIKRIESSPEQYPFLNHYRYWPGPNSNTYAQWVLHGKIRLGHRGIGRSYGRRQLSFPSWCWMQPIKATES